MTKSPLTAMRRAEHAEIAAELRAARPWLERAAVDYNLAVDAAWTAFVEAARAAHIRHLQPVGVEMLAILERGEHWSEEMDAAIRSLRFSGADRGDITAACEAVEEGNTVYGDVSEVATLRSRIDNADNPFAFASDDCDLCADAFGEVVAVLGVMDWGEE